MARTDFTTDRRQKEIIEFYKQDILPLCEKLGLSESEVLNLYRVSSLVEIKEILEDIREFIDTYES